MKYEWETEEQFRKRQKEAKAIGQCVFRDDNNREMILNLINSYLDVYEAVADYEKEQEELYGKHSQCKEAKYYKRPLP